MINCLRRLSDFPEIVIETSPLWGRTVRAKHTELARLQLLMPRLSEAFVKYTASASFEAQRAAVAAGSPNEKAMVEAKIEMQRKQNSDAGAKQCRGHRGEYTASFTIGDIEARAIISWPTTGKCASPRLMAQVPVTG